MPGLFVSSYKLYQLQWASAISNSHGTSKKVRDSGKFKILVFFKALKKPNTLFTSLLTLVSLAIGERKYIDIFTVIVILFLVKIRQIARLFSSCIMHMQ